jgi:hypothetical protein
MGKINMNNIKKDLFDLFQLDKMPPEKSEEMLNTLANLVFQAVLVRALPMLSEEDLNEYEKIVSSDEGGDVLFKFLAEKVPEFNKMITEEAGALRREATSKLEK